ncbi:MAG: hypothetical protein IPG84_00810 [Betaproteobacteria bacterium]|nr:hypothetical protein [Betaproteobacteria bacterium]
MFSPCATAVRRACRLLRFNGCRAHSRGASRKEPALGTILLWNDDWDLAGPARPLDVAGWELARDRRHAPLADAIVFHVPTLASSDLPEGRRPGQRWVAWSMESEVNYPQLADPAFVARFDLAMTYRRDADVWVPYLPRPEWLAAPVSPKTEPVPAVYFASSAIDRSGRHAYVAELMRHVAVDCYGACHRNRTLARDDGRTTKLATIARYRFTLAFENSIARDYVTEKFYDPLVAGSGAGGARCAQRARVRACPALLHRRRRLRGSRGARRAPRRDGPGRDGLRAPRRVEAHRVLVDVRLDAGGRRRGAVDAAREKARGARGR